MAGDVEIREVAMTLHAQLPALQIVVPFMTAPLIVFFGKRETAWWLAFLSCSVSLVISYLLLMQVIGGGFISYQMGGWAPPLGIEYRIDAANGLILFLISLVATITMPFAYRSIQAEITRSHTLFYACLMLCFTGLMGMVITGDAFNVFVFLEVSSLSTYVLVAMGAERDKRALTAAFDYLILGTIGATFFVIGIGFLYMATGTLNMADLADRIQGQESSRTVRAGFAFIVVGLGLKAAMVPLHLWLPRAYTYAPSAVTVFLAATATKASIYVMLRFMFSVYQPEFVFHTNVLQILFIPLALLAMFGGSFVAVFQTDMKRMLAYSSIGQIGYMLLGIAMLNQSGVSATMVHMFNHGITKAVLFMGVGAFVLRAGSSFYDNIGGLGRKMPVTGAVIVIGGLSLIGIPGTAGFVSKWLLVQAAFENDMWPIALLIVLSSLLAVIYVWRVFEVIYLQAPNEWSEASDPPMTMLVPMIILAVACVYFGIFTDLSLGAAGTAAEALLNGSFGMAEPSLDTSALPLDVPHGAGDAGADATGGDH
ncbi:monovalent cation/H+ antiporter subunit D family protein [Alphaproteobacteria bacterium KMM 3653]|uniref:Monovalent cation/H+ antiporter subunit D family protein n=1 Tax=Harenicola maris TaxID=2841044 RepID=A0AAP2CS67_9RHOB|nr:monovalent cation/H+ antiporter subunit D family protein [Harenicola maris]